MRRVRQLPSNGLGAAGKTLGCVLLAFVLSACGANDQDAEGGAVQVTRETHTAAFSDGEATIATYAPSPTVEQTEGDAVTAAAQVSQRLASVQKSVDFRLVSPADVLELEMLGEPNVSGSPAEPVITVNLASGGGANARLLTFTQIGDVVSGAPPQEGQEQEELDINGVSATLITESANDGMRVRMQWHAEETTYQLTGVNLEASEVLQVARSMKYVPEE